VEFLQSTLQKSSTNEEKWKTIFQEMKFEDLPTLKRLSGHFFLTSRQRGCANLLSQQ
jgi:hypothetical protein